MAARTPKVLVLLILGLLVASTCFAGVVSMEGTVPESVLIRLPNSGFDAITDLASSIINAIDINTMIENLGVVYSQGCEEIVTAVYLSLELEITQANFGDIAMDIGSNPVLTLPGGSDLYVLLELHKENPSTGDLLGVHVDSSSGLFDCYIPLSFSLDVDASLIQVGAALDFGYDSTNGLELIIQDMDVQFHDFEFDISNFPDELESWVAGTIAEAIEDAVIDFGEGMINDLLDDYVNGILLYGDTSFLNYNLHWGLTPDFQSDVNGITINSDSETYVSGTSFDSCAEGGWPLGSQWTDNSFGAFGTTTPTGDAYHVAVAIGDDMLNQLIYSIIAKGELCFAFDEILKKDIKGYDLQNIMGEDFDSLPEDIKGSTWRFAIYPAETPLAVIGQGGNDVSVVLNDLRLDWLVEKQGRYVELLNASMDVNVGVDVEMDANQNLIFTFNNPTITTHVHGSSYNNLLPGVVQSALDFATGLILPMLQNLLPPYPLPGFAGLTLSLPEVAPGGTANDYLVLYLLVDGLTPVDMKYPDTSFLLNPEGVQGANITLNAAQSALYGLNNGRKVVIKLQSEGESAVDRYFYSLDGLPWQRVLGDELTLVNLMEGEHEIQVKAKDALNVFDPTPATLNFICDNVPPRIQSLETTPGRIQINAVDYVDDALAYHVKIDQGPWNIQTSSQVDVSGLVSGKHTISVKAVDSAGNQSAVSTATIEVNSTSTFTPDVQGEDQGPKATEPSIGGCGIGDGSASVNLLGMLLMMLFPLLVIGALKRVSVRQ